MSTQGTIKHYTLIIEKVKSAKYPSSKIIREHLARHDFEISERTFQRNIEAIRNEFGVEITYDRKQNGYFINEELSIGLDTFLNFLEIVATAELLTESLKEGKEALNYISFEAEGNLRGIEYLKSLLFAVKNHRKILFTHLNFDSGRKKNYKMKPYLLKEYQNRWYIVGLIAGIGQFMAFGIDRIENLEVLTETFVPDKKLNPLIQFENIIGISYSPNEPEEIILSFTPLQGQYIKSLPLHKSQQIIEDNELEVVISLNLKANFELIQRILMLGDRVKVLEPEWLVEEIKLNLNQALSKYK